MYKQNLTNREETRLINHIEKWSFGPINDYYYYIKESKDLSPTRETADFLYFYTSQSILQFVYGSDVNDIFGGTDWITKGLKPKWENKKSHSVSEALEEKSKNCQCLKSKFDLTWVEDIEWIENSNKDQITLFFWIREELINKNTGEPDPTKDNDLWWAIFNGKYAVDITTAKNTVVQMFIDKEDLDRIKEIYPKIVPAKRTE